MLCNFFSRDKSICTVNLNRFKLISGGNRVLRQKPNPVLYWSVWPYSLYRNQFPHTLKFQAELLHAYSAAEFSVLCRIPCGAPAECYYSTIMLRLFFIVKCGIAHFSALCVYSKFGHHPHPLDYLCAKFRFFRGIHYCASPWRKIAYSITHPAYLVPQEPNSLCFGNTATYCCLW